MYKSIAAAIITTIVYISITSLLHQPFDISKYEIVQTTIDNQTMDLAVAMTPEQKAQGFMYISKIPENQGMYFFYSEAQARSFWMKNTFVPLDIIFLDSDHRIINIHKNTPPCQEIDPKQIQCPSYKSSAPSQYIIELPSPQAENLNLQTNQKINIEL